MKNKMAVLIATCYTLTALCNLALAIEGKVWPVHVLCAFGFAYLAVKMYRRHSVPAKT